MIAGTCPQKYKNCPTLLLLGKHRDQPAGITSAKCAECGAIFTGLSMGAGDLFWTVAPMKKKRAARKKRLSRAQSESDT